VTLLIRKAQIKSYTYLQIILFLFHNNLLKDSFEGYPLLEIILGNWYLQYVYGMWRSTTNYMIIINHLQICRMNFCTQDMMQHKTWEIKTALSLIVKWQC